MVNLPWNKPGHVAPDPSSWWCHDHAVALAVVADNRAEQTTPLDETTAYGLLKGPEPSDAMSWEAEGSMDLALSRQQLVQHARAMDYVVGMAREGVGLSPKIIQRAHEILMENAMESNGMYRTTPCVAGGTPGNEHVYMAPEDIPGAIEEFCRAIARWQPVPGISVEEVCAKAAWAMFQFLEIHPFENGNGRVARLLVQYVYVLFGASHPMPLTNGRSKNQKHYAMCIYKEARGMRGYLEAYLVECYRYAMKSFG